MTAYEMKRFHERKHMNENYEDCKITSYQHSKLDYHDDTEHILYIKLRYV